MNQVAQIKGWGVNWDAQLTFRLVLHLLFKGWTGFYTHGLQGSSNWAKTGEGCLNHHATKRCGEPQPVWMQKLGQDETDKDQNAVKE